MLESVEAVITNHSRRLQKLMEKQALFGASVDPSVLIEIEDIQQELARLSQLQRNGVFHVVDSAASQSPALANGVPQLTHALRQLDSKLARWDENEDAYAVEYIPEEPPALDRFVDREAEFARLSSQFDNVHLVVITGLAGVGKTQLAGRLRDYAVQQGRPCYWHRFVPSDSLDTLCVDLSAYYAYRGREQPARMVWRQADMGAVARALLQELRNDNALVFLDNYEIVADGRIGDLIHQLMEARSGSLVVLTTRTLPDFLELRDTLRKGVLIEELEGFPPDVTEYYLKSNGVLLEAGTLDVIHEKTRGHPLLLDLLLSQIISYELTDEDIRTNFSELAAEVDKYLLQNIWDGLPQVEKELLGYLSVAFVPLSMQDLVALTDGTFAQINVRDGLAHLERRRLVRRVKLSFTIHAVVRDFVYTQTAGVESLHARLASVLRQRKPITAKVAQEVQRHLQLANDWQTANAYLSETFQLLWSSGYRLWVRESLAATIEQARRCSFSEAELRGCMLLGRVHLETCEWNDVMQDYSRARELINNRSDKVQLAFVFNNEAEVLARRGRFEQAFHHYGSAVSVLAEEGLVIESALVRHNMGAMCARYGLKAEGAKHCAIATEAFKHAGRNDLLAKSYSLLALLDLEAGEYDEALAWCRQDMSVCEDCHDYNGTARVLNNMAVLAVAMQQPAEAISRLEQSLQVNDELGDFHAKAQSAGNLGLCYQALGEYDRAQSQYLSAYGAFAPIDDQLSLVEILHNLSRFPSASRSPIQFELKDVVSRRNAVHGLPGGLRFLWNVSYGYLPIM